MAKFISFLTQKGGTGKTTLTVLAATYLDSIGANVAAIDCDFPQHSLQRHRNKDLDDISSDLSRVEELKTAKYYPITTCQVNQVSFILKALKTSSTIDFVFVDVPGTLNIKGIDTIIDALDLIIIPCELEFKSVGSALETVDLIKELNTNVKIAFLWTKIKKIHKIAERKAYEEYIRIQHDIYIFDYILFDTVKVSQFLSTTMSDPKTASDLIDEIGRVLTTELPTVKLIENGQEQ